MYILKVEYLTNKIVVDLPQLQLLKIGDNSFKMANYLSLSRTIILVDLLIDVNESAIQIGSYSFLSLSSLVLSSTLFVTI